MVAWWKRRPTWQKILMILVLVVIVLGPFLEEDSDSPQFAAESGADLPPTTTTRQVPPQTPQAEQSEPTTTSTAAPTTTSTAAPPTSATVAPTTTSIPQYEVFEEKDVSFAGTARIQLGVTAEKGTSREGLSSIAEQLAWQYRESHEYQALIIFFYHYRELANEVASLGVWDDSPYGDWGRAADVARGDYSTHGPTDKTKEKDWSLLPKPDQLALFQAYNFMYDLMDTDPLELPSDDDVMAAVASDRGLSVVAVEEAIGAVFDWIFNE